MLSLGFRSKRQIFFAQDAILFTPFVSINLQKYKSGLKREIKKTR